MVIGKIYITGVIGEETTILDVIRQVKAQRNATEFLAIIDSVGGIVEEGKAIYDYLRNLPTPVSTYAKKAYSIASIVFMAGERRIVDADASQAIMIHLPWMEVAGSHDEISSHLVELKAVENELVKFYAECLEIDKATIQSLLQKETYLDASQAIELGFATELKASAPAMAKFKEHNEKEKSKNWMNKAEKVLNAIAKSLGIRAELVLQDATGVEIIFPDLNEGEVPEGGEKATVDSKDADGEFLMPDGSTLSFEKGLLKEILPAEPIEEEAPAENVDEPAEEEAPADDKDARIAELEAENEELKAKLAELEGQAAATETSDQLLSIIEASTKKIVELESKYETLAKSVGSDFQHDNKKEKSPNVKASAEGKSRAWHILNS